jgi:hypothetical protein
MTAHNTPDPVFNAAANSAEAARQAAIATASGTGATLQANVRLAEITYYRAVYKAAVGSKISPASASMALAALGAGIS